MVKDATEVDALRRAATAVDRILADVQAGNVALAGRTEAAVAAEIAQRILDEGHRKVNFTIVASGPNAASPHHEAADRVIRDGEGVLFDIGGTMDGADGVGLLLRHHPLRAPGRAALRLSPSCTRYSTRRRRPGWPQRRSVRPVRTSTPPPGRVIDDAGYGEYFVHRTGHGIGVEAHEHPNIVVGNDLELVAGHAFSIEPGIYVPGTWGARLEDIVVATDAGPDPLNHIDHGLAVVG